MMHTPFLRAPLALLTTSLLIWTGCGPEPPSPSTSMSTGTTPEPEALDLAPIVGANFNDPSTSPLCMLGIGCAPLSGERRDALRVGTCMEAHFQVNEDDSREFIDEVQTKFLTNGRISERTNDRGTTTLSFSGPRLENMKFEPSSSGSRKEQSFEYALGRLSRSITTENQQEVDEQSFTYDDEGKTLTSFRKQKLADGSFERTSKVYNYTGDTAREVWDDADVDKSLSAPDVLSHSHQWNEDGLLTSITRHEAGEVVDVLAYTYDAQGNLTGADQGASQESTSTLYTLDYTNAGRLQSITFAEGLGKITFTRDAQGDLSKAQRTTGDGKLTYEIEMSGSSCDRTVNSWLNEFAQ